MSWVCARSLAKSKPNRTRNGLSSSIYLARQARTQRLTVAFSSITVTFWIIIKSESIYRFRLVASFRSRCSDLLSIAAGLNYIHLTQILGIHANITVSFSNVTVTLWIFLNYEFIIRVRLVASFRLRYSEPLKYVCGQNELYLSDYFLDIWHPYRRVHYSNQK